MAVTIEAVVCVKAATITKYKIHMKLLFFYYLSPDVGCYILFIIFF